MNVVKSRLPGANQARNHGAAVLDEIQGSACIETPWLTPSNRLRHRASPAHLWLLGVGAGFIRNVTSLYGVLYWQ